MDILMTGQDRMLRYFNIEGSGITDNCEVVPLDRQQLFSELLV